MDALIKFVEMSTRYHSTKGLLKCLTRQDPWLHEKLQVEHKTGFLPIGILGKFEPIASNCSNQLLLVFACRTRNTPLQDATTMALHPNIEAINRSSIEDRLKGNRHMSSKQLNR